MIRDENQYEQLILLYTQLKNGAEDIAKMLEKEDYDNAITMINAREQLFLNCKCIRKYLELTPVQQKETDKLVDEIRELELKNIKTLEKGMEIIQSELKQSQKSQKIQQAYNNYDTSGNIVNYRQ